jgi:hypothetical protein
MQVIEPGWKLMLHTYSIDSGWHQSLQALRALDLGNMLDFAVPIVFWAGIQRAGDQDSRTFVLS